MSHTQVTGDEVRRAVLVSNEKQIMYRRCSICDSGLFFEIIEDELFVNTSCECTSRPDGRKYYGWEAAADYINMQSSLQVRNEIRQQFGMDPEEVNS